MFNDLHGLIYNCKEAYISYMEVLKLAGLKSYTYHALAEKTPEVERWSYGTSQSFLADLERHENGYVAFLEETRATIFKHVVRPRR